MSKFDTNALSLKVLFMDNELPVWPEDTKVMLLKWFENISSKNTVVEWFLVHTGKKFLC